MVCIVSIVPLISNSSSRFFKLLGTIAKAPTTVGTIVTFMCYAQRINQAHPPLFFSGGHVAFVLGGCYCDCLTPGALFPGNTSLAKLSLSLAAWSIPKWQILRILSIFLSATDESWFVNASSTIKWLHVKSVLVENLINITPNLMFHSFFNSLATFKYLSIYLLHFHSVVCWSDDIH